MSVDPLAEETPDWTPYRYGFHNPLRFTDPTGMSEEDGNDTFIYLDKNDKVQTKVVNTGENTPNRLFVQDTEADPETPNRLEHEGMYFEQKMIPSSEYTDEDYKAKLKFNLDSQFDKDRRSYIWESGVDYTDSEWSERLEESIKDDPVTIEDLKVVLTRKSSSTNTTLGNRKGERGFSGKPSGTNNPYKHIKPDPSKPGNVIYKHPQTGKKVSRPATPDEKSHFGL